MSTRKCLAVLVLVVATNFSQSFAAPTEENVVPESTTNLLGDNTEFSAKTTVEDTASKVWDNVASATQPTSEDKISENFESATQKSLVEDVPVKESEPKEVSEQSLAAPVIPAATAAPATTATIGQPQDLLTEEQENEILKKIPEFEVIMRSIEELPVDVYAEIKAFLQNLMPRMPATNLVTLHLQNALLMTQLFDRVVRVVVARGSDDPAVRQELFAKVHKALPDIKKEFDAANELVGNVRAQLEKRGISADQTQVRTQIEESAAATATAQVADSVPNLEVAENTVQGQDGFAAEFAV